MKNTWKNYLLIASITLLFFLSFVNSTTINFLKNEIDKNYEKQVLKEMNFESRINLLQNKAKDIKESLDFLLYGPRNGKHKNDYSN
jgi:hypothetical protein